LLNNDNFVSKGLQRTNRKIGKTDSVTEKTKHGYVLYPLTNPRVKLARYRNSPIQSSSPVTPLRLSYTYLLTDMSK